MFVGHSKKLSSCIDCLIEQKAAFALYRLPATKEVVFVLQEDSQLSSFDSLAHLAKLNQEVRGFLFAPFAPNQQEKVLLIRPDHHIHGLEKIKEFLTQYCADKFALKLDGLDDDGSEGQALEIAHDTVERDNALSQGKAEYSKAFSCFMDKLQDGTYAKLVLSRSTDIELPEGFSYYGAFMNACASYPSMMVSLVHSEMTGTWLGSTPEIILSGSQEIWQTVSLAGTMPLKEGYVLPKVEEWSDKNRKEQEVVSEYIRGILEQYSSDINVHGPFTTQAGKVVHLKTKFIFTLDHQSDCFKLLDELHPTPAVCGLPKQSAYDFICAHEGYSRSYYAGVIGFVTPEATNLFVNLRCMRLHDKVATLYAGGGILTQSTLDSEFDETKIKMSTMCAVF